MMQLEVIEMQSHFSKGYGCTRKLFLQSTELNDHAVALVGNGQTKIQVTLLLGCPSWTWTQQSLRKETKQSLAPCPWPACSETSLALIICLFEKCDSD
jgi:hypothetical protein